MVWLAAVGGKRPIGFSSAIKTPPQRNLETILCKYSIPCLCTLPLTGLQLLIQRFKCQWSVRVLLALILTNYIHRLRYLSSYSLSLASPILRRYKFSGHCTIWQRIFPLNFQCHIFHYELRIRLTVWTSSTRSGLSRSWAKCQQSYLALDFLYGLDSGLGVKISDMMELSTRVYRYLL